MGLTAIVSSSASSASSATSLSSVTSLTSAVGLGAGGIFVAAALVILLAYLDLFDASDYASQRVRRTVVATITPLGIAFAGIVLFQSMQVL